MRLYDAHNHLHDLRLAPHLDRIVQDLEQAPLAAMVVNGTHRGDWEGVVAASSRIPGAIPAFGVHPWFLDSLQDGWVDDLMEYLETHNAPIGEIGIDFWKDGIDRDLQESVFRRQLDLARVRNLPVTIHGLKAWSRLLDILRERPSLPAGFLLHSYAGPEELVKPFADLGGYFSCSGAALHPKREKLLKLFAFIPEDRLLIESDAPDQLPPPTADLSNLTDTANGDRLTHPLSIVTTYTRLAMERGVTLNELTESVERNFHRLFGRFVTPVRQA